jgi:hypothetical protein
MSDIFARLTIGTSLRKKPVASTNNASAVKPTTTATASTSSSSRTQQTRKRTHDRQSIDDDDDDDGDDNNNDDDNNFADADNANTNRRKSNTDDDDDNDRDDNDVDDHDDCNADDDDALSSEDIQLFATADNGTAVVDEDELDEQLKLQQQQQQQSNDSTSSIKKRRREHVGDAASFQSKDNEKLREIAALRKQHNIKVYGDAVPAPIERFADMQLPSWLLKSLEQQKFDAPRPIQMQAIPILLAREDLIAYSETGYSIVVQKKKKNVSLGLSHISSLHDKALAKHWRFCYRCWRCSRNRPALGRAR